VGLEKRRGWRDRKKSQIMFSANYTYCVRQRRDEKRLFFLLFFVLQKVGIKNKTMVCCKIREGEKNWNEKNVMESTL
jgi:hypothetical protein